MEQNIFTGNLELGREALKFYLLSNANAPGAFAKLDRKHKQRDLALQRKMSVSNQKERNEKHIYSFSSLVC